MHPRFKGRLGIDRRAGKLALEMACRNPDELLSLDGLADEFDQAPVTVKKIHYKGLGPKSCKTGLNVVEIKRGDAVIWLHERAAWFIRSHPDIPVRIR